MSRSKEYQAILNGKDWQRVRAQHLATHPYCERCLELYGRKRFPIDVHHKIPVESVAKQGIEAMRKLALDPLNLEALCVPCHVARHKEMGRGTKQLHQQREADRARQRIEQVRARQAKGSDTGMKDLG